MYKLEIIIIFSKNVLEELEYNIEVRLEMSFFFKGGITGANMYT